LDLVAEIGNYNLLGTLFKIDERGVKQIRVITKYPLLKSIINWFKTGKWIRRKEYLFDASMKNAKSLDGKISIDFEVKDKISITEK
jgi:hypothetical protein